MNFGFLDAYENTTYRAFSLFGEVDIRIGQKNSNLDQLLLGNKSESWAFITAFNPYSVKQKEDVNRFLNKQLEEYLNKNKYVFFDGLGIGDDGSWQPEPSFLILNISKDKAVGIGRQFHQNAIVAGVIYNSPVLIKCFND